MSLTHLCATLLPACNRQLRNKLGNRSCTQRTVSSCINFVFVLFRPVRSLVSLIAVSHIRMSNASDWTTGDLRIRNFYYATWKIPRIMVWKRNRSCFAYLSGVSKQATLSRLSMKAFVSSIEHRCNRSFVMFVVCTDLTVMDISWIQSQPEDKRNVFTYTYLFSYLVINGRTNLK